MCRDYDACPKCRPNYKLFHDITHRKASSDGETHDLVARAGWKEYESRPTSPSHDAEDATDDDEDGAVTRDDDENGDGEETVVFELDTEELDNELNEIGEGGGSLEDDI